MTLKDPNIEMLEKVVNRLGDLTDNMAIVGGCTTSFLRTEVGVILPRKTVDVDFIVAVSRIEYYNLQDCLKEKGFFPDQSDGAPICRFKGGNLILDVMPTDPKVFGFGSEWHQEALLNAKRQILPSGNKVSVISAPYFLACKFAAFEDRGEGDYLMSRDIEDIVSIVDGRKEIIDDVEQSSGKIKSYLKGNFKKLLSSHQFQNALPGFLPGDSVSQLRIPIIVSRIRRLAQSRSG